MLKFEPPRVTIVLNIKPLEERHFVTLATILMIVGMLIMAREDPKLWDVELFKTLLTAMTITGFLNMVLSFHYAANKGDEKKTDNTAAAFEAIRETARTAAGATDQAAADAATRTADAAVEQARQEGDSVR